MSQHQRHRVELSPWLTVLGDRAAAVARTPARNCLFTDHDGYRFQVMISTSPTPIVVLSAVTVNAPSSQDRIRDYKDTGLSKLPFQRFAMNEVWVEIVMLAHDLIVWTQALVLDGELAIAEP